MAVVEGFYTGIKLNRDQGYWLRGGRYERFHCVLTVNSLLTCCENIADFDLFQVDPVRRSTRIRNKRCDRPREERWRDLREEEEEEVIPVSNGDPKKM